MLFIKKRKLWLLFVLLSILQAPKSFADTYALILGMQNYQKGWPDIPDTPRAVNSLSWALYKQNIKVESALNLNSQQVWQRLKTFKEKYNQANTKQLLFFFLGHGGRSSDEGGLFFPSDMPRTEALVDLEKWGVGLEQLSTFSKTLQSPEALFFFFSPIADPRLKKMVHTRVSSQDTHGTRCIVAWNPWHKNVGGTMSQSVSHFIALLSSGQGDHNQDGRWSGSEMGRYVIQQNIMPGGSLCHTSKAYPEFALNIKKTITTAHQQAILPDKPDVLPEKPKVPAPEKKKSSKKRSSWKEPHTQITFMPISGGCFTMGDKNGSKDETIHKVCLNDYWLGQTEVTQEQWRKILPHTPEKLPGVGNLPVAAVSFHQITKFIQTLNRRSPHHFRLPSEAEWEFACRERGRKISQKGLAKRAWFVKNSNNSRHPVAKKAINRLGLFDIQGNVWEWTADWYDAHYYRRSPKDNPVNRKVTQRRTIRGGSWINPARFLRCANRYRLKPESALPSVGFRLVWEKKE
ncbi:SUMF1/EgtB/PvdO family nonheme iron enzyme [Magnetococcales bacterium HHB-1]